ncbi:MAG: hypothetical protein JWQ11_627 [Rhizobacter sp.]|jgi:hypothetical protein|nr:hypothetical protein [Rhizobacter sp.]
MKRSGRLPVLAIVAAIALVLVVPSIGRYVLERSATATLEKALAAMPALQIDSKRMSSSGAWMCGAVRAAGDTSASGLRRFVVNEPTKKAFIDDPVDATAHDHFVAASTHADCES